MAKRQREIDTLANQPEVRSYLKIANRVHKKELVLTAEQIPQFQKMVVTAEAPLKAISKMSHDLKSLTAYQQTARDLAAKLIEKRSAIIGGGHVSVQEIDGETIVRTLNFDPDGGSVYDVPAKDIKARLRGVGVGGDQIFSGQSGTVHWELEQH